MPVSDAYEDDAVGHLKIGRAVRHVCAIPISLPAVELFSEFELPRHVPLATATVGCRGPDHCATRPD